MASRTARTPLGGSRPSGVRLETSAFSGPVVAAPASTTSSCRGLRDRSWTAPLSLRPSTIRLTALMGRWSTAAASSGSSSGT